MRKFFALLFVVSLVACTGSRTRVYDERGRPVGRVAIANESSATIFDEDDEIVGRVIENLVYNSSENIAGSVTPDDRILDREGKRVGRLSGEKCLNRASVAIGKVSDQIDDEAAGGACLLLLIGR